MLLWVLAKVYRIFLSILLSLLAASCLWSCMGSSNNGSLRVTQGFLDLSHWSASQNSEWVELRGDWQIIAGEHVPAKNLARWEGAQILKLPGSWVNVQAIGMVSLRARVQVKESQGWGLFLTDAPSAIAVWVNGIQLGASGVPSYSMETTSPSRKPVFIPLPDAKEFDIVIHMSNFTHSKGGIYYPIRFGPYSSLQENLHTRHILEAGFIASILMIGLYHAFLSVIRREEVTIIFTLCCFVVAQRIASSNTRLFDIFFDPSWEISYRLEYGTLYSLAPLMETFAYFLFPSEYPRKFIRWRMIWFFGIFCSIFLPISLMTQVLHIVNLGNIVTILVCIYTQILATKRARVGAPWIMLATISLSIFSLIDIFAAYQERTGTYTLHIGFLLFILFQAGAIAKTYVETHNRMIEEESKRKHSFRQLGKVFYPHQLLMMEAGGNLEDTMPTGKGQGCVICFDIISSTNIKHINKNRMIKDFFTHCYEIMMENYSADGSRANAYRIKEMGDGFLCSVGYPFQIPDSSNAATFASNLALRFIASFEQHIKALDYPLPVYCAVGIAGGDLEGFYPQSGTREYDLYGRAVILATRYESMRQHLFKQRAQASILILQEEIFLSLPNELRTRFVEFNLLAAKLKVRDDPTAHVLHYAMLAYKDETKLPLSS